MSTATMTSKGQLTVPLEVRADLRLHTGDKVRFEKAEDGFYRVKPVKGDIMRLAGIFKYDGQSMSIEQMNEDIGRAVAERFERSRK